MLCTQWLMSQCIYKVTEETYLDSLLISTGVVALAEIGDKTQLLAFLLAARFKKPLPIILGILVATIFNHALAGALGAWITTVISPELLRWILGGSFIAMAIWTLIPDEIEEEETMNYVNNRNYVETMFVFVIMVIAATRPILLLHR